MLICPNTSPLLVLARLDRLDLLANPHDVRLPRAVLAEVHDKHDEICQRVDRWIVTGVQVVEAVPTRPVDPIRALGAGERSVLSLAAAAPRPPCACSMRPPHAAKHGAWG